MPISPFKTISLERTMCYGDCPVYTVKINANGRVKLKQEGNIFEGWKHVVSWQIDRGKINKINEVIHKYGYFTLKENEGEVLYATDHPYCITKIELQDGTKRKIEHYLGDNMYPKRLTTIENWIDKLIETEIYLSQI
ncbi:DUF6438 domain-containing protein [Namhaeicola litoreus]|uniref:DUF6438 domain-containing protein n=1 Tax=Namhaeicola litoreus TaxID=1052145 RepID=A0ABW3Y071_9FLAO